MAITNAQQYQQLVNKPANGKRPGYRGSDYASIAASSPMSTGYSGAKSSAGKSYSGPSNRDIAMGAGGKQKQGTVTDTDILKGLTKTDLGGGPDFNTGLEEQRKENKKTVKTFTDNKANYSKYTPSYIKFLADLNRQPNRKYFVENVLRAGKIPGVDYASLDDEDFDIEQVYKDYMSDRLAGNIDAMGNPLGDSYYNSSGELVVTDTRDDGAGQKILPMDDLDDTEEEVNPRDYTGLAPRFMGSSFDFTGLAEGGRVAAQQGGIMSQQGGIMPRLSDLSGDVSSAEQMLQEINQRLESAESTLGEGGNMRGTTIAPNMSPLENAMRSQQPLGPYDQLRQLPNGGMLGPTIPYNSNNTASFQPTQMPIGNPLTPAPLYSSFEEMMKNRIQSDIPSSFTNLEGVRSNPDGTPYTPPDNNQISSLMTNQTPGGPMQSPIAGAMRQGAMDGGRMRQMEMMEDEDDPTGGIMDLESGRQMYFLGKLVKKATRAVKKVAKSPFGKAALGAALFKFGGGGKGLASFFGKGSFNPLRMAAAATSDGPMTQLSPLGQLLSKFGMATGEDGGKLTLGGKIGLGFGLPFALDALGVGKKDDEGFDIDEYYRTGGINIADVRMNPYNYLSARNQGSLYAADGGLMRTGYQEGGDAEPVAKKTMPLLDMDGMEKDYRADGGFVPIGRMERADDVPARLSKNEFVFTADAVRNAGEGDIDKGAEVMYNMMKNLESGGEVSEESQGLDGAKEMFQTSQRLEEVL